MLPDQRSLFSLPDDLHYLNCASSSPMPIATHAAGQAALDRRLVPMPKPPSEYLRAPEELRSNVAALIGCSADSVAVTPAVSYGIAIAANNWPIAPGQIVVVPEEEFPSDVYAWIAACERTGGVLRTVQRPDVTAGMSKAWSDAMLEAIDEDTAVVSFSSVHWTDGVIFDAVSIAERARSVGALVVVDATQSLGATPFDFDDVAPDLLLCSSYKWLFGPSQIGFAVVGDRLIDSRPLELHWSNRAGSEDVSGTGLRPDFRDGARRFDVGGHANDVPLAMLNASFAQVLEWRPERVQEYCAALMGPLETYLASSPYRGDGPTEHASHILGIRADDAGLLDRAMDEMTKRNVRVSRRGTSIRVSPHVYNTSADIDAVIDALDAALV